MNMIPGLICGPTVTMWNQVALDLTMAEEGVRLVLVKH